MTWFQKDVQKREFDSSGAYRAIQYLGVNPNTSGSTQIIAAQSGLRIIVLQVCVITSGAAGVSFFSSATPISAAFPLATNGGFVLPYSRHGWFQTAIGEPLMFNLDAAVNTAVQLTWVPSL